MLDRCCCCIQLRVGCFLIGVYVIIASISNIYYAATELQAVGEKDENEDQENIDQKNEVKSWAYVNIFLGCVYLLTGLAIIIATAMRIPLILKTCAALIVALAALSLLIAVWNNASVTIAQYIMYGVGLALSFYLAIVLWSYAKEIEYSVDEFDEYDYDEEGIQPQYGQYYPTQPGYPTGQYPDPYQPGYPTSQYPYPPGYSPNQRGYPNTRFY